MVLLARRDGFTFRRYSAAEGGWRFYFDALTCWLVAWNFCGMEHTHRAGVCTSGYLFLASARNSVPQNCFGAFPSVRLPPVALEKASHTQ
jgi:hypothetical protein